MAVAERVTRSRSVYRTTTDDTNIGQPSLGPTVMSTTIDGFAGDRAGRRRRQIAGP
jgi:hypothetical protein